MIKDVEKTILEKDEEIYRHKIKLIEMQEAIIARDKILLDQMKHELENRRAELEKPESSPEN